MLAWRKALPLLLLVALPAGGGQAAVAPPEEPAVRQVSLSFRGNQLMAEAELDPSPPPQVSQRLSSGLPTTTTWEVRLLAARDFWFDGFKDERKIEVTATYRPVTSDWTLEKRLDGKLLETRTVTVLREAEEALTHLPPFPVFTMGDHVVGKRLVVKVRCTYATGISLGVIPVSIDTGWTRSGVFTWPVERP